MDSVEPGGIEITQAPQSAAPPPGADHVGQWENDEPMHSGVILGTAQRIIDTDITVHASACQWADGTLETGIGQPTVTLMGVYDINSDQARELASALLQVAAQVDGWAGR